MRVENSLATRRRWSGTRVPRGAPGRPHAGGDASAWRISSWRRSTASSAARDTAGFRPKGRHAGCRAQADAQRETAARRSPTRTSNDAPKKPLVEVRAGGPQRAAQAARHPGSRRRWRGQVRAPSKTRPDPRQLSALPAQQLGAVPESRALRRGQASRRRRGRRGGAAIAGLPPTQASTWSDLRKGRSTSSRGEWLKAELLGVAKAVPAPRASRSYKLGWTLYKRDLNDARRRSQSLEYVALLDHKVSTGYDFDHADRRGRPSAGSRTPTASSASLLLTNPGGARASVPAVLRPHTASAGYEDRIYGHLGGYCLDKRRYQAPRPPSRPSSTSPRCPRLPPHFQHARGRPTSQATTSRSSCSSRRRRSRRTI